MKIKKRLKIEWNDTYLDAFINICIHEILMGNKSNSYLNKIA